MTFEDCNALLETARMIDAGELELSVLLATACYFTYRINFRTAFGGDA